MGQGYLFILLLLVATSITVPLSSRRKRIRREDENFPNNTTPLTGCMLDNQTYERGQEVPSLGPCEKCVCEAPDVVCSMIKCQQNSGCRIIQQSGQCCPEYKCDCEYNGLVYNNGEKLDKPEDPCQVCYCKGGEIMCTSITCYERDDCQPHYTAGQCCPKYDHCPVENNRASGNSVRSVNTSIYSPKREMQPWPLTKPANLPTSVSYDELSPSPNIYPQTIRIVEILPTTPVDLNKPSEVSVIPRIKTNENSASRESEESSKIVSSTSESSSTDYSSTTSEIEHLLETTPEAIGEVKHEPTTVETVSYSSSTSTLNPLAESIDPNALPDSQSFSTVFPNYYYTEGDLNSIGELTTNIYDGPEGSGYDILSGGVYDEITTLTPDITSEETTTGETSANLTSGYINSHEIKEEKVSDLPTFEAYTGTTKSPLHIEEYELSPTTMQDELYPTPTSSSENESVESTENSSELPDEGSIESVNATALADFDKNNSSILKENIFSERLTDEQNQTNDVTTLEPLMSTITTVSFDSPESSTVTKDIEDITTTENDGLMTTVADIDSPVPSIAPSEIYLVSQTPDEPVITRLLTERKNTAGNYRNLNSDVASIDENLFGTKEQTSEKSYSPSIEEASTSPSSISFPPVLNVHSLDYSEMSPQKENITSLNSSSMAKVGIYRPTKPNELASYLTVVDDKNNASSASVEAVTSHILLTPNDLKKLAEILIHEKIKPPYTKASTDKNETDSGGLSNYDSIPANYRSVSESESEVRAVQPSAGVRPDEGTSTKDAESSTSSGVNESLSNISNSPDTSNIMLSDQSATNQPDKVEVNTLNSITETEHSKEVTSAQDEMVRSILSVVSGQPKLFKDVNDDPNTSRKIRIPDNMDQFSAFLDDRDLKIFENFYKKTTGLH